MGSLDAGLLGGSNPERFQRCTIVHGLAEWDPGKARLNVRKHGISFADAVASLEDEAALTMRDPFSDDEERWVAMVETAWGGCSWWSYTWRGESVRLISARKATGRERGLYEDAK